MSSTRYYRVPAEPVATKVGEPQKFAKTFLVDAKSYQAAEKHVAAKYIGGAEIATPREIADLMGAGVKPETAKGE